MPAMICVLGMFIRHPHSMRGAPTMHLMSAFCGGSVNHVFSVCVRCWLGMGVVFHLGMVMALMFGVRVCHFDLSHLGLVN